MVPESLDKRILRTDGHQDCHDCERPLGIPMYEVGHHFKGFALNLFLCWAMKMELHQLIGFRRKVQAAAC
jgi:hypothetical protein